MNGEPSEPEQAIRAAWTHGDFDDVASRAFDAYGAEVLSFLQARLRNTADADEAFSIFAEALWVGLPKFGWRCSMRTWAYTLARNAVARVLRRPERRAAHNVTWTHSSRWDVALEHARNTTAAYAKTEVKDRFRRLREQLSPEDQMLLILRVDRNLAWRDLAIALTGDIDLDDASIARESARLRQAFLRIKSELRNSAKRAGLIAKD